MSNHKIKIHPDHRNSRAVIYNRWSSNKAVDDLVTEIMSNFSSKREPKGYHVNMKVLVLDLFESYYYDPEQKLSYYRNNNHYDFKKNEASRYNLNPYITVKFFTKCVDHLIQNDFVRNYPGGYFKDANGKRVNSFLPRLKVLTKFIDMCSKHKLTIDMVEKFKEEELIRLKPAKKDKKDKPKPIEYVDDNNTISMRRIVREYNTLLDNTYLDLDIECLSYKHRDELVNSMNDYDVEDPDILIKLSKHNVFRVFNNSSFEQGGRWYGAFWIGCPDILRRYITIQGNQTVELDYSGIHIQLIYALRGVNYASLKQDAYELVDNDPERKLNKKILLTAINASSPLETASSVFDELREEEQLSKYSIKNYKPIYDKLELLKQKHSLVADYISSGKGIKLQYYDSMVIEQLVNYFTSRRITILTVHDSIICEAHNLDVVKDKMLELYSTIINKNLRKFVTEDAKENNRTAKMPHVKYQKTYKAPTNWQILLENNLKYKTPSKILKNSLFTDIAVVRRCVKYFLYEETYIKIKIETRDNKCYETCKTHKRKLEYLESKNIPFKRTIKLRLNKLEGINSLTVNS